MDCFLMAEALSQQHEKIMKVMKYAQQPPHLLQTKYSIGFDLCVSLLPIHSCNREEYKGDFVHLRTYREPDTMLSFSHDVSYRAVGTKTYNPRILMCKFGSTDAAKALLDVNDLSAEDCNLFHR